MQRSPISTRQPSIDSLCMPEDEGFSLTAGQDVFRPASNGTTVGVPQEDPASDTITLPPTSDSSTTFGSTGPGSSIRQPQPTVWKTTFFRGKWIWETTCIIFSIACVIAITILSSRLDGTWLSKWTFFLQPSTTFSILATAAQSSMMLVIAEVLSQLKWLQMNFSKARPVADFATFDSASRGPLGSLRLFYLWKPQSHILSFSPMVYAASLITVAAMAIGPLTQQVISIQADNLVPTGGMNSTIAVANFYNYQPAENGLMLEVEENGVIRFLWDEVGSKASDVDPDIQGAFYNGYYNLGRALIDFSCPSSNCSWESFNSLGICSTCQNVTDTTQMIGEPYTTINFSTPGGWSIGFDPYDQVVADANQSFLTLDTLTSNLVSMVVVQNPSRGQYYTVTECSIDWCARQYSNVTITNGTLQPHFTIREVPLWLVTGQDFGGLARGVIADDNWEFSLTSDADGRTVSEPLPPFDHNRLNVSIYDHGRLSAYFVDKFTFTGGSSTSLFGDKQNVSSTLSNITNSITNAIMRSNPGMAALGIIWHQEPSIRVQWGWLALPIILTASSAILLASIILASRHYDAPHWKSSPLPFLFHGIRNWNDDEELDLVHGQLEKMHVMEYMARSKHVQIVKSLKGGRWLAE